MLTDFKSRDVVFLLPINVIGRGHIEPGQSGKALGRRDMPNLDQSVGVLVGTWDGVDDAEDSGIRAYAQSKHDHRRDEEARILAKQPERISEILY